MTIGSVGALERLKQRGRRAALFTAAFIGTMYVSAANVGYVRAAGEEGTLQDVPYSAPVLSVLTDARHAVASGQPSEALSKLHQVLEFATPAFTLEKLELHRQVARAFVELGYPDHAVRTLQAALQDARVAGHEDVARAIEEDLKSLGVRSSKPSQTETGVRQAGWLSRLFGREHSAQHHRPVHPHGHHPSHAHAGLPIAGYPNVAAQTAPQATTVAPAMPLTAPGPSAPGHLHAAEPNGVLPYPSPAYVHNHPVHRVGIVDRIRHWWHRWMPQARARTTQLAPRPVSPPPLPQYPVAGCENCQKRGLNPSVAHPPAPPLGTLPPIAGPSRGVPLSPYSAPRHTHSAPPRAHAPTAPPSRPSLLGRIGGLLRRPFAGFRRRDAQPIQHVSPGWPPLEPQVGEALSPDVYPR